MFITRKKDQKEKRFLLLQNVSWVFCAKIISMALFMLTDMIIARALGRQLYGEWGFYYSVLNVFFYLFWFGVNSSSKVFATKETDLKKRDTIIYSSFILRLAVSFGLGMIILAISKPLAISLGYPEKYSSLFLLIVIGVPTAISNSVLEYYKQVSSGLRRFRLLFWCTVLEYGSILLFVCLSFIGASSLYRIAVAYALGTGIAAIIILRFILPQKKVFDKNDFFRVFKYSLPLALLGIGGMIMVEMDTLMLGILSTSEQVAIYAIAKSLTTKASQVNYSITAGTIQEFAVITVDNVKSKHKQFTKIVLLNLLITIAISLAFLLLSYIAVLIIYGREYLDATYIIYCLLPYYICLSVSNLYSNFMDFQDKASYRLACYSLSIVLNFVFNYLFIPKWGAYGAALASGLSILPYMIILVVVSNRFWKKILGEAAKKINNI